MRIPEQFGVEPHLDDEGFAEIWAAGGHGGPEGHPHLAHCAACRERFAAFGEWLDGLREEAWAEADEAFPAARLTAQRAAITARLEALAPARVLPFPAHAPNTPTFRHHRSRWIAAAAAAGLILGLGAGQMLHLARPSSPPLSARSTPAVSTQAVLETSQMDDTVFYSDAAVTSPHVEALQALDALTPRIRDIDLPR